MDLSEKLLSHGYNCTKIERKFKKNGRVLTAVVVGFDLDTKLYVLEWEKENADTTTKTIIRVER